MAELESRWSTAQTRSQFAAIAWLRWRITVNSFRRKGAVKELAGRIFLYLTFASITLFFVIGAAAVAFYLASSHHLPRIAWLLWATFVLCQFLNIQLGQPATTFDPTQLIRFPLALRSYAAVRLFFGVLSPANIVGTLISLAIAVGIIIAVPSLWLFALIALAIFAITNVLFSRMIFSWIDRWLSTRRAREVFTGLIFAFSIAIQWANFNFNPAYTRGHGGHGHEVALQRAHLLTTAYQRAHPVLMLLPPELTSASLVDAHSHALIGFLSNSIACALFAALFLAIFALRMRTEFRGESFSDRASSAPHASTRLQGPSPDTATHADFTFGIRPAIIALLGKELIYLRRHMGILYGLLMPVLLVLVFAGRFASRGSSVWVFPAAVGYTLLAIAPLSYNAFGFEASGSQLYFLAPVRMQDVLLAKNLFSFLMAALEVFLVFLIITYIAGMPSPRTAVAAVLWAAGTLALNAIFGNRRSFTTPKKINPLRMANKQTSQFSALISLGVLAVSAVLATGLYLLCMFLHVQWLLVPVCVAFAAVSIFIYMRALSAIDIFALNNREPLFAELCKQS